MQHTQLLQPGFPRRGPHGVAVVGMQHQGLLAALADPLADVGPADLIGCNGWVFVFGEIPGDDHAAPDIDHQVEVQPHPTHGGGQVVDVPALHLART